MSLAKGIISALENSIMKGVNNAATNATQKAAVKQAPYSIKADIANLYNDINTTRATTITAGRFGEANAKMLEKINEIVERGGTRAEIEDTMFQTAGVYSHTNNVPLKNSLTTAHDSATRFLNRVGYDDMPNLLNKTQDEYNALYSKHQATIESAHIDPNFETKLNMKFNERLKKQNFERLEQANNILYFTGQKMTDNETTNLKLFGLALDNRNKQQIDSLLNRVQRQLEQERPIYEQTMDDLINNLLKPTVTKSDIMKPLLGTKSVQELSFGEANDILSSINYLLKNRREATIAKNFTKKDWDNLKDQRGKITNYLQSARSAGQTPLSKTAHALSKGKRQQDKNFLRQATGQDIYNASNRYKAADVQGRINAKKVGYSIKDLEGNEVGLVFRQDELPQILDSGLSNFPKLRQRLQGFALMTSAPGKARKNLPFDLRKNFVPDGIIKDKNDLSINPTDEVIPDNFTQMYNEITSQLNLELPTHNGIYYKNLPDDEHATLFAYYADKYILLKTNQNLGEFLPKTLELDKQRGLYNINLAENLISKYNKKTQLTPAINKFLTDLIDAQDATLATGISKVITQAYPEYFNQYLKYTNILPAIERLKNLQKNLGYQGNDLFDMLNQAKSLAEEAVAKGNPNSRQIMNIYRRYEQEFADIYREFDRYVQGLRAKMLGVQSIDLPDAWLVPHIEEKSTNILSDGKGGYRVIDKSEYDLLKAEYGAEEGTKQEAQNYGTIASFSDEFDILDPGKGQFFNKHDQLIEDTVKEDFRKYGGEPDLEHFYEFDTNPLPKANEKIILQPMNLGDDITNLKNLHEWLVGKAVTKNGKTTYPNRWALNSQISYLATASNKLELDDIYDKLMNYRNFVKLKKQELLSYKTPGKVKYLDIDNNTMLENTTELDAGNLYNIVLNELDKVENTINAGLHQINWKWFNNSLNEAELAKQASAHEMATDSTMLDFMLNEGKFSDEPLNKQTYLDMRAGRIPSQQEVLQDFINSKISYLFTKALDTNVVKEQYDALMTDLINGLYIKTEKDYWSNALLAKMSPNKYTELKDLNHLKAEDYFNQRKLGFSLDRMSQENRHEIDHFTRVLKNIDRTKNSFIDTYSTKKKDKDGNVISITNNVRDFIEGTTDSKDLESLVSELRQQYYNLFKLTKDEMVAAKLNAKQQLKDAQNYNKIRERYDLQNSTTQSRPILPPTILPKIAQYSRTKAEMNIAFDGMLYNKETRQWLVLNAIMQKAEQKVSFDLPLPKLSKNTPIDKSPSIVQGGLKYKDLENIEKRAAQRQQEKDWIDEWTRKKNEENEPRKNQAAGLDELIKTNPPTGEFKESGPFTNNKNQASGIDKWLDDMPF